MGRLNPTEPPLFSHYSAVRIDNQLAMPRRGGAARRIRRPAKPKATTTAPRAHDDDESPGTLRRRNIALCVCTKGCGRLMETYALRIAHEDAGCAPPPDSDDRVRCGMCKEWLTSTEEARAHFPSCWAKDFYTSIEMQPYIMMPDVFDRQLRQALSERPLRADKRLQDIAGDSAEGREIRRQCWALLERQLHDEVYPRWYYSRAIDIIGPDGCRTLDRPCLY